MFTGSDNRERQRAISIFEIHKKPLHRNARSLFAASLRGCAKIFQWFKTLSTWTLRNNLRNENLTASECFKVLQYFEVMNIQLNSRESSCFYGGRLLSCAALSFRSLSIRKAIKGFLIQIVLIKFNNKIKWSFGEFKNIHTHENKPQVAACY